MLYLYLFDYAEAFLPFIHTICPTQEDKDEDIVTKLLVSVQNIPNTTCFSSEYFKTSSIEIHDVVIHCLISLQHDLKKKSYKVSSSLNLLYVITRGVTITFNKIDLRLLRLQICETDFCWSSHDYSKAAHSKYLGFNKWHCKV